MIPTDDDLRMRVDLLELAMDADFRRSRRPIFVSASGGSTNSGAVDPLPKLADLCAEREVWFHVDAAYGGFSILAERGRRSSQVSSAPTSSRSTRTMALPAI